MLGGDLFVHTSANPYGLMAPITRMIHDMSADQPVEHAATLSDVRSEVLTRGPAELDRVRRLCDCGVGNCCRWRRRRAGLFGECADSRVWHSAGDWVAAEPSPGWRHRPGRALWQRSALLPALCLVTR